VFLKVFYELYNKNNYFGVKKLFYFNLSILSVFFIFFQNVILLIFFLMKLENGIFVSPVQSLQMRIYNI